MKINIQMQLLALHQPHVSVMAKLASSSNHVTLYHGTYGCGLAGQESMHLPFSQAQKNFLNRAYHAVTEAA